MRKFNIYSKGRMQVAVVKNKITELEALFVPIIEANNILGILDKKESIKVKPFYILILNCLLLQKPHILIGILNYQITRGLNPTQIVCLKTLTTFLNACQSKGYF